MTRRVQQVFDTETVLWGSKSVGFWTAESVTPRGMGWWTGNASTTSLPADDTWVVVEGTMVEGSAQSGFSVDGNALVYEGAITRVVRVIAALSVVLAGGGNDEFEFAVGVDGAEEMEGIIPIKLKGGGDRDAVTLTACLSLANGQGVTVRARDRDGANTITVTNLTLTVGA